MELLNDYRLYDQVMTTANHFESYAQATKEHPPSIDNNQNRYIQIRVGDDLRIRLKEEQQWKKDLIDHGKLKQN